MYIASYGAKIRFSSSTITVNVEIIVEMNNCIFANFVSLKLIAVLKLWNCDVQLFYKDELPCKAGVY